jgi:hypothetical protein
VRVASIYNTRAKKLDRPRVVVNLQMFHSLVVMKLSQQDLHFLTMRDGRGVVAWLRLPIFFFLLLFSAFTHCIVKDNRVGSFSHMGKLNHTGKAL